MFSNSFTHHYIFILSNEPIFRYDTLSLHMLFIKFFNNLTTNCETLARKITNPQHMKKCQVRVER